MDSKSSNDKTLSSFSTTDDQQVTTDEQDVKRRRVITDEKKIEQMKKELLSEAKALSEDFGVDVCMVCYDPNQPSAVVSVWPEDSQKLMSVIERFKTENPSVPYSEPSFTITNGEAEAEAEAEAETEEEESESEDEIDLEEDEEEEELSEDEVNRRLEELVKIKEKLQGKMKELEEEQERRDLITQRNSNNTTN